MIKKGRGAPPSLACYRPVCAAQNAVTEHLIENGTKKVRSEGKIKAQLPFRVSPCLHIVFQDLTKKLGVLSL
ncbi:hypothetical protein [Asticcacaulis benevestitus]|uniref:hypothetical protein n=1 Tax=Asticcacaulis benevestitus TaxID=347481 RepID=UPI0012DBE430|nr:hypothetical protein [Asticcacaulis benevestitus]